MPLLTLSRLLAAATAVLAVAPFFVATPLATGRGVAVLTTFIVATAIAGLAASLAAYRSTDGPWLRCARGHAVVGSTVLCAGGLAYLAAVADEPTAIPIGGFAAILLGLAGLIATSLVPAT